jgi:CRISPR-associated protein Csx10
LGALAWAHTILRPNKRDEFAEFFLRERIYFGNLYPADFRHPDLQDDSLPVCPLPRTAHTCKRFPGFLFGADLEEEERHGVTDHLIPWALFALSGEQSINPLNAVKHCPECRGVVDRAEGFYRRGLQGGQIGRAEVKKGIRVRIGISRLTGTAAPGILYGREVLHEGTLFWGTLRIADKQLFNGLRTFVEEATSEGLLRLGNNRTRGFGRVVVSRFREFEEDDSKKIARQARTFDRKFREKANECSISTPHRFYLPLTLLSDTIISEFPQSYRLLVTGDYLAKQWDLVGAHLVYHNAGRRRVMGWSELWGLPKADEWAITMGSVFLFGFPEEPDFEVMARIQNQGIGSRRSEGFGQVRLADPFHQEDKFL